MRWPRWLRPEQPSVEPEVEPFSSYTLKVSDGQGFAMEYGGPVGMWLTDERRAILVRTLDAQAAGLRDAGFSAEVVLTRETEVRR